MTTTTETPATALPSHAWVAMQQFTPAEQKTVETFTDYLEVVIARYAGGRVKESGLAYFLRGTGAPWIGTELNAFVADTCTAWWRWMQAETGDYDVHAVEPEWQDEVRYVERCRELLDEELAALAKAVTR